MEFDIELKSKVHEACVIKIQGQLDLLQQAINGAKEALTSETKSSAGDKHETGRAMAQLEMEKLGGQYQSAVQIKQFLIQIDPSRTSKTVATGSLLLAKSFVYFVSVGLGKLDFTFDGRDIYAISPSSPLAQSLLGKSLVDDVNMNGRAIVIEKIL